MAAGQEIAEMLQAEMRMDAKRYKSYILLITTITHTMLKFKDGLGFGLFLFILHQILENYFTK